MSAISIVIGEDHLLMREGLRRVLGEYSDFEVVGDAGDGQSALNMVESLQPDVALLDIRMPVLSGIEVVRQMKDRRLGTRALVLTAYDDDVYVIDVMNAGAAGYILKSTGSDDLAEAIRRIHCGAVVLDPRIELKVLSLWKAGPVRNQERHGEEITSREKVVLILASTGLRNKEIAEKLGISVRTVEGHFNNILSKLAVSSRTAAILYALSRKWTQLSKIG